MFSTHSFESGLEVPCWMIVSLIDDDHQYIPFQLTCTQPFQCVRMNIFDKRTIIRAKMLKKKKKNEIVTTYTLQVGLMISKCLFVITMVQSHLSHS